MTREHDVAARLARYYDLDLGSEQPDVDLYRALASAANGPVLELAAGSGRIAVALAAAGHEVVGIDHDAQMLARARDSWAQVSGARKGDLTLIEADITSVELDRRFSLVILALNTLLMLPGREAQVAALHTMARQLAADGRAVLDVWLPSPDDLALYDGRLTLEWTRTDPQSGETVAKLVAARHDAAAEMATVETFFDVWPQVAGPLRRVARVDQLSFIGSHELLTLVEEAGLRPDVVAGDYSLGTFGPGSERMVLICGLL
ncbi:MAG: class I SAM-dependent methyltransferase [Chloroflexota bacterium]|nr:class I SAM-dependent methyltransferase [Chloroflexota bacterium]